MNAPRRGISRLAMIGLLLLGAACAPEPQSPPVEGIGEQPAEAISFLGGRLMAPDPSQEMLSKYETAKSDWTGAPEDADAIIWYGRRTAYLGRYQEAIRIYSSGIELHPGDARLYRHRGHRYISTRQLDLAIADFEAAAALVDGQEDEIEPDGMPNALSIPVSTLHSNIWYHLGLAHYLRGDFDRAVEAYGNRLASGPNDDMLVSTTHWLYMALMRLGREAEAAAALEPISPNMEIIENSAYQRLCLFYRGEIDENTLAGTENGGPVDAAVAYGIGNWHLVNGRRDRAVEIFERIIHETQWAAFGHIAAEAELARSSHQLAAAAGEPPPPPGEKDRCAVCGMFVHKYRNWIATIEFTDGSRAFFDGPKDLFRYLHNLKKYNPAAERSDVIQVWVTDYYTTTVLKAEEVLFVVGSDVLGPMGRELVVVGSEEDAKAFVADHGGEKMLRFADVTSADIPN